MSNIATTIEQSKELVRLGLDPKTADMYYLPQVMNEGETLWPIDEGYNLDDADQPAWSLSALLEVMPSNLYYQHVVVHIEKGHYSCIRNIHDPECEDGPYGVHATFGNTAIESAYEMVCWLFKKGLIKKGGQDD